jgi:integrase
MARNCAVVTLDGKNHYLGPHESPESHERYNRLIHEWLAGRSPSPSQPPPLVEDLSPTIDELVLRYWEQQVTTYYLKNGAPTSEQSVIRGVLCYVRRLYGSTPAKEFGPLALNAVREAMIQAGRCRTAINRDVHRIRVMFRWAVAQELVPVAVHQALMTVPALSKGRSQARESKPVKPAPREHVEAILPFLSPPLQAMVELQLLTGMRPGEAVEFRMQDIELSKPGRWLYRPRSHKTEHHDRERMIPLGPQAQALIHSYCQRHPHFEGCLFSPQDAFLARKAAQRDARTSRVSPSERRRDRQRAQRGLRYPGHYSVASYRHAIQKACRRAGVPRWHPNQIRHLVATEYDQRFGIETARILLGHSRVTTTQIYTERDLERLWPAVEQVG